MPLHIAIRPYRLPFRRPFVTSAGTYSVREGFLVRVHLVDDPAPAAGYGEAAPLPGHGGEPLADVVPALRDLARALAEITRSGADLAADPSPPAWRRIMARLRSTAPDTPAALAALDLALADLLSRRAGLPLARWLNTAAADSVDVNLAIGAGAPDAVADQARAAVAAGYRTLKLKVGAEGGVRDSLATAAVALDAIDAADLQRVAAVRQAVGPAVALRLDANGAWDEQRAVRMLRLLAPFAIEYVEQPVPGRDADRDVDALARVRAASPIPIAADEILTVPGAAERVVGIGAADVLVAKPALMSGLAAVWDLAERAAARVPAVDVVVTTALDSAVGRTGALHLAAALPGRTRACGLATGDLLAEDVAAAVSVSGGAMKLAGAVGLGLRLDEEGGWVDLGG